VLPHALDQNLHIYYYLSVIIIPYILYKYKNNLNKIFLMFINMHVINHFFIYFQLF